MTIISMAHIPGMRVVTERVETGKQLRILQALSCNEVQGYLASRLVAADDAGVLLEKRFFFEDCAAGRVDGVGVQAPKK
jgi:EAL domain-containing protein (putative c-di-GMP-specific phosphodiesterase class I)